jgi:transcription initiation factor TFIIH subunit 4
MKVLADLLKRGTSGSFGVPSEKEDKKQSVDLGTLDNLALEKWEVGLILLIFFPL